MLIFMGLTDYAGSYYYIDTHFTYDFPLATRYLYAIALCLAPALAVALLRPHLRLHASLLVLASWLIGATMCDAALTLFNRYTDLAMRVYELAQLRHRMLLASVCGQAACLLWFFLATRHWRAAHRADGVVS